MANRLNSINGGSQLLPTPYHVATGAVSTYLSVANSLPTASSSVCLALSLSSGYSPVINSFQVALGLLWRLLAARRLAGL
jgi:hypothetical protein